MALTTAMKTTDLRMAILMETKMEEATTVMQMEITI